MKSGVIAIRAVLPLRLSARREALQSSPALIAASADIGENAMPKSDMALRNFVLSAKCEDASAQTTSQTINSPAADAQATNRRIGDKCIVSARPSPATTVPRHRKTKLYVRFVRDATGGRPSTTHAKMGLLALPRQPNAKEPIIDEIISVVVLGNESGVHELDKRQLDAGVRMQAVPRHERSRRQLADLSFLRNGLQKPDAAGREPKGDCPPPDSKIFWTDTEGCTDQSEI